jgi:hypothetical protein
MKPKFTDKDRYPVPYRRSESTDITKAWARAREKLEADRKEREAKVQQIRKIGTRT